LLLIIGISLLTFSSAPFSASRDKSAPNAGPIPTTTPSPITVQVTVPGPPPSPVASGSSQPLPPPPVAATVRTNVPVPTYVAAPVAPEAGSNTISLITTFSGLASSVLGLVAAFVSLRARNRRPTGGAS